MNDENVQMRAEGLLMAQYWRIHVRTDHLFAGLMGLQFVAGVLAAVFISPKTWAGAESSIHPHVLAALGIGGIAAALPIFLAIRHSGSPITRYTISASQAVFSGLFIHLSGGRIETHFHVFGSLAFLAFYRDWRVLIPATLVTAADHMLRGVFWPQSVFGVVASAPWRALEHAGWVVFIDVFLIFSCVLSARDIKDRALRQADLEHVNEVIEKRIEERTTELAERTLDLEREVQERKALESQLVQAQKLESIGQLAAGVAHEINTPAQYVSDNIRFLQEQFGGMLRVIDHYSTQIDLDSRAVPWSERAEGIRQTLDDVDFDFLMEEIPSAIEQSKEGMERITEIVRAMKDFSHPGSTHKEVTDLNRAIESTVMVCKNRWKYAADLEMDLASDLPKTPCLIAEFNQVILNIIVNAADAIDGRFKEQHQKGLIRISTRDCGSHVEVRVSDNGGGMPEDIRQRIFDPFFTTKDVGEGTGQGLAISRDVIVGKHGGELECESVMGEGSTFIVRLPLEQASLGAA